MAEAEAEAALLAQEQAAENVRQEGYAVKRAEARRVEEASAARRVEERKRAAENNEDEDAAPDDGMKNYEKTSMVTPGEREILRPFYQLFNSWGYEPIARCSPSYFETASLSDGVEYQAFTDPLMRSLSKVAHGEHTNANTDILWKFRAAAETAQRIKALRNKKGDAKYTHYMALLADFKSERCGSEKNNNTLLNEMVRMVPDGSYLFFMLIQCARLLLAALEKRWDDVIELNTEVQEIHQQFIRHGVVYQSTTPALKRKRRS